jgi:hypothetical protein
MRYLLVLALAIAVTGCGGARSKPRTPAAHHATELVNFQRNGGLAATLDTVTVHSDGATRTDKRYGGAGRRYDDFRLSAAVMARLRAALERLPARAPAVGDGTRMGATYLLRYHGRTYVAREGAVPAALRPAVSTLRSIIQGRGRGGPVHSVTQAPA